jgi:DNA processing protein
MDNTFSFKKNEGDVCRLEKEKWPPLLQEMPDPPKELWYRGDIPLWKEYTLLSVIGSRHYTEYGKMMCEKIITECKDLPLIIVSGLALGIDGIAHKTALSVGLLTLSIPGSGLDSSVLYPRTHFSLAEDIIKKGGMLLSEFPPLFKARTENFPKRNRIMAGISHAVLIIEAEKRSGTLITARLALSYNKDIGAVPGDAHRSTSYGPHFLIQNGAMLVQNGDDIAHLLSIEKKERKERSPSLFGEDEEKILSLLSFPLPRDILLSRSPFPIQKTNALIASLEIKGVLYERMGCFEKKE